MKKLFVVVGFLSCLVVAPADALVNTAGRPVAAGVIAPQAAALMKNAQYVYVAKQLGLLDPSKGFLRRCYGFVKNHELVLSVVGGVLGAATVVLLMALDKNSQIKNGNRSGAVRSFGEIVKRTPRKFYKVCCEVPHIMIGGVAIVSVLCAAITNKFIAKSIFADDADWYRGKLMSFVQQWKMHKPNTPRELHPLFDQLAASGPSLDIDPLFAQQLISALNVKTVTANPA